MPSIVVLPFANLSGDKERYSPTHDRGDHQRAANVEGGSRVARTPQFSFKGKNSSPQDRPS